MGRYRTLDGLRGVAALSIVVFHVAIATGHSWFPRAWLAVDFFFMLSGFVIAHAYQDRIGSLGLVGFARLRIIRLWPMVLLSMVLATLGWGLIGHRAFTFNQVWQGMLLIPQLHGPPFPLNHPLWSLFFEVVANFAWAALALRVSNNALVAVIVVSGGIALAIGGRYAELGETAFLGGFARTFFAYSIGVLCYRNRVNLSAPAWVLALVLIAVFWIPRPPGPVCLAIIGLVFPAVLLAGAGSRSDGPVLRLSGDLSYPVYALHGPIGFAILLPLLHPYGRYVELAVVPLVLVGSWVALKAYDVPVRRFLTARSRSKTPAMA